MFSRSGGWRGSALSRVEHELTTPHWAPRPGDFFCAPGPEMPTPLLDEMGELKWTDMFFFPLDTVDYRGQARDDFRRLLHVRRRCQEGKEG